MTSWLAGSAPFGVNGATIGDMVDLERREVAMRVLSDPEIHLWRCGRSSAGLGWDRHIGEFPTT